MVLIRATPESPASQAASELLPEWSYLRTAIFAVGEPTLVHCNIFKLSSTVHQLDFEATSDVDNFVFSAEQVGCTWRWQQDHQLLQQEVKE